MLLSAGNAFSRLFELVDPGTPLAVSTFVVSRSLKATSLETKLGNSVAHSTTVKDTCHRSLKSYSMIYLVDTRCTLSKRYERALSLLL